MTIADTRKKWLALLVLCLGDLFIVLDVSIVNVALPSIQTDLKFTTEDLQWVVSGYALTFGGLLLLGGRAGDLLTRLPGDHHLGFDVDRAHPRIRVLIVHDELQRAVESVAPAQPRRGAADAGLEHLPLVHGEGVQERLLGSEPAIQRGPGDPGLLGDIR